MTHLQGCIGIYPLYGLWDDWCWWDIAGGAADGIAADDADTTDAGDVEAVDAIVEEAESDAVSAFPPSKFNGPSCGIFMVYALKKRRQ